MNVQTSPVSDRPEPRGQQLFWSILVTIAMLGSAILTCLDLMRGHASASTWASLIFIITVGSSVACTSKDNRSVSIPVR